MSNRVTLLRETLAEWLAAIDAGEPQTEIIAAARTVLVRTGFAPPVMFPAGAMTREGKSTTLLGVVGDAIVGAWIDDDGVTEARSWNLDGSTFGANDPDDTDLIPADDAVRA